MALSISEATHADGEESMPVSDSDMENHIKQVVGIPSATQSIEQFDNTSQAGDHMEKNIKQVEGFPQATQSIEQLDNNLQSGGNNENDPEQIVGKELIPYVG